MQVQKNKHVLFFLTYELTGIIFDEMPCNTIIRFVEECVRKS